MKPEIERAMREVLEAWETPDSPEALVCAIYQMKRIYMAAVVDSLNRKKLGRPRKHSRHNVQGDGSPDEKSQPTR
jgi:hypothetical protein